MVEQSSNGRAPDSPAPTQSGSDSRRRERDFKTGGKRGISKPEAREGFRRSENDGTLLVKLLHTFNHGELGVFWTKLMTNFTVKDVN